MAYQMQTVDNQWVFKKRKQMNSPIARTKVNAFIIYQTAAQTRWYGLFCFRSQIVSIESNRKKTKRTLATTKNPCKLLLERTDAHDKKNIIYTKYFSQAINLWCFFSFIVCIDIDRKWIPNMLEIWMNVSFFFHFLDEKQYVYVCFQ